ncbi:hypothetical protein [uncultured Shimia sp.]|uniref:hypothetical protein n=1 Tax=uncultured Shimia sp. TaxID=573152 RepID=UPI00261C495A|nr:hypothetical protein [uncultured Shimia sp.]
MRSITITYEYAGPDAPWRALVESFIAALDSDDGIPGSFSYQVAVADNGTTRIHWGRWDSAETLAHVQAQDYFKSFAGALKDLAGDTLSPTGTNVMARTANW